MKFLMISLLIISLVLIGCTNNSGLAKLEKDVNKKQIEIEQDINPVETIDMDTDISDIENTFIEEPKKIISDEELDSLLSDIENMDDVSDFDVENNMNFDLNLT